MGDGGQARPVEDHDGGEPGAHRRHLGGVARRHRRHQAGREALKDLRKEGRPQIATALKERFGARLDPGERRIPPLQRVDQGLTQRLRGPQHHRGPEADQGFERPHPLPLGRAHRAEDRPTQGRRDVLLQQIDDPQQIDRLRALGYSPSWRWGCYDSVNATSGDLPSNYLSGDDPKTGNPIYWTLALISKDSIGNGERRDDETGESRERAAVTLRSGTAGRFLARSRAPSS